MCKVLIVDDNAGTRQTLSDIVGADGHTVLSVSTGSKAVEEAGRFLPDIALVDLKLGDMSGLAVVQALQEVSPSTQCVIVTGHATQKSAIEALNMGVSKYLQKPYDPGRLLSEMRGLVVQSESSETHMVRRQEEILAAIKQINGYVRAHGETLAANCQWVTGHERRHKNLEEDQSLLSKRLWALGGSSGLLALLAALAQFLEK